MSVLVCFCDDKEGGATGYLGFFVFLKPLHFCAFVEQVGLYFFDFCE
jgi:hypothetical protein